MLRTAIQEIHKLDSSIVDLYDQTEGEETPETVYLEALRDMKLQNAVGQLAAFERSNAAVVQMVKTEKARLAEVSRRAEKKVAWARAALAQIIGVGNSCQSGTTTVRVVHGRPRVEYSGSTRDLENLRQEEPNAVVVKTTTELDKVACLRLLKQGRELTGVSLKTGDPSVRMR